MKGVRVRSGVDLAHRRADALGSLDLGMVGVNEHRYDDAGFGKSRHRALELRLLRNDIETPFGRDFVASLRDEHRHFRLDASGDADHLVGRRHFKVEPDMRELTQAPHVFVLDMPAGLAQMDGDALRATEVRLDRRPNRVGFVRAPGLPYRSDVVDVHAELDHRSLNSLKTARVCSTCPCRRSPMSTRIRLRASSRLSALPYSSAARSSSVRPWMTRAPLRAPFTAPFTGL